MAMLEVKDLEVYYGMIQAIKGISSYSPRYALITSGLFKTSFVLPCAST